jgi:hypothetical protein
LIEVIARTGNAPPLVASPGPRPSHTPNTIGSYKSVVWIKVGEEVADCIRRGELIPNGTFGVWAKVINGLGSVDKKHLGAPTGKIRMITKHNLPAGDSLNDHPAFERPFSFTRIEDVAKHIRHGMFLNTFDLERFYRAIGIADSDLPYFAFEYDGQVFIDLRVDFGHHLSPTVMETISRIITRKLCRDGHFSFSYLDDWLQLSDSLESARKAMDAWCDLIDELGFTENRKKRQEPATKMVWLGVEFDSLRMTASFPTERVSAVQTSSPPSRRTLTAR